MKLAIRIFAFAVVVAGAAAASFSSSEANVAMQPSVRHFRTAVPGCGPGMGCPVN